MKVQQKPCRECPGGAINTVVNLINQLKTINDSIEEEKAANIERIKSIEADQVSLENLKASNYGVEKF